MYSLHKKDTRYENLHICHQLNSQQNEYIKFQNITIHDLLGELESKQKLENLLDTLFTFTINKALRALFLVRRYKL